MVNLTNLGWVGFGLFHNWRCLYELSKGGYRLIWGFMKIELVKIKGGWHADLKDMPGTPPCGQGKTKRMAIASLFFRLIRDKEYNPLLYHVDPYTLSINDEIWEQPGPLVLR